MINTILKTLNEKLFLRFLIEQKLLQKSTARSLQKYILKDEHQKKYLLEIASNSVEIFYFKRTLKNQEAFSKLQHSFKLNIPLYKQVGNKFSFALYEYFDDISFIKNEMPLNFLNEFYKNNEKEIELNNENIEKILSNFLSAWPNKFHSMIKRQKEFQDYKDELKKYKSIKVAFEHGDFTSNNIFLVNKEIYLMDFEFSRNFQPVGFDIFDYYTSIKKNKIDMLHSKKYILIEKINDKMDKNNINIEIYNDLENVILMRHWEYLYIKGSNYNLSYLWCKLWLKYFKKKNQKIFIFTIWNDDNLVFLAPLYKSNNNLYLIGSNPDLFDSFDLLYTDVKYIKQFYNFIFKNNYNIDFRYLDANSVVSKVLIKYLYQNDLEYESTIIDTKPIVNLDNLKIKTKEKSDVKRCKNRAVKYFNAELKFEMSVDKNINVLDEFISIHKKRWEGGPFINIEKFDLFIKEISKTDLVILSKLSMKEKTLAYHLAYKDSFGVVNSAIPSYSNEYDDISPGKVLLYEILNDCKEKGMNMFDFGRGAEEYKYWFANQSSILFHIKTYNQKNIIFTIQKFSNRVFNKFNRMFYA